MIAWWTILYHLPKNLEDQVFYNSNQTTFQLVPFITVLNKLFTKITEPLEHIQPTIPLIINYLPLLTLNHHLLTIATNPLRS